MCLKTKQRIEVSDPRKAALTFAVLQAYASVGKAKEDVKNVWVETKNLFRSAIGVRLDR